MCSFSECLISYCYAECSYAGCHVFIAFMCCLCAESHSPECHNAKCHSAECHNAGECNVVCFMLNVF